MGNDSPRALPAEDRLKRPGDATGPSHSTWRTNVALQLQMAGMGEFLVPATGNGGGGGAAVTVRNRRQAARASIMMSIDDVMLKEQLMLRFDDTRIIEMMAYIESLHAGDEQASIGAVHSLAMGAGQTLVEFWMVALLAYQRLAATYPLAMQSSTFLSIFITAMLKARPELIALAGDMRADISMLALQALRIPTRSSSMRYAVGCPPMTPCRLAAAQAGAGRPHLLLIHPPLHLLHNRRPRRTTPTWP